MLQFSAEIDALELDASAWARAAAVKVRRLMIEAAGKFLKAALAQIPVQTGFVAGAFSGLAQIIGNQAKEEDLIIPVHVTAGEARRHSTHLYSELPGIRHLNITQGVRYGLIENPFEGIKGHRPIEKVSHAIQKKNGEITFIREFYYPPGAGRAGRVLKTPRSGLPFATPPDQIFDSSGQSGDFSGGIVFGENAFGEKFTFNFSVNIIYFSIEDAVANRSPSSPWNAFKTGQRAFREHLRRNIKQRIPKLGDFIRKTTYIVDTNGGIYQKKSTFKTAANSHQF